MRSRGTSQPLFYGLIIAPDTRFVNPFFRFSEKSFLARPAVPLPEPWGCEPNRLAHIYIPHNRTPCGGGHGFGRSPTLLVGLTDSHGSHPQPCGVLGFAIPFLAPVGGLPPPDIIIIAQTPENVKHFFKQVVRRSAQFGMFYFVSFAY